MRLGNGDGGVGGPGGTRGDPNARVMAVLAQMGLEGVSQLPNGSIRLPDGRIVGNFGLEGGGSGSGGEDGDLRSGEGGGRGLFASGILKEFPESVQMMVEGLEASLRSVKKKLHVSRVHRAGAGAGAFFLIRTLSREAVCRKLSKRRGVPSLEEGRGEGGIK